MSGKIAVGYDGSEASNRALEFAVELAKCRGDSLVVAHVLEWSPYSFLTPTELEERHKRRKEEIARADSALMSPVVKGLQERGIEVEPVIRYGHIADTLCAICNDTGAAQVIIGRAGENNLGARIFGSVAGSLVQTAPVPCTIVP